MVRHEFAIKADVSDPEAKTFAFKARKTMYGGKHIAKGDMIFVFASENEGWQGLIARGIVTSAEPIAKKRGIARQTPRVSITIRRTALRALDCLEQCAKVGFHHREWIDHDADLDPLRDHPRYRAIVEQLPSRKGRG